MAFADNFADDVGSGATAVEANAVTAIPVEGPVVASDCAFATVSDGWLDELAADNAVGAVAVEAVTFLDTFAGFDTATIFVVAVVLGPPVVSVDALTTDVVLGVAVLAFSACSVLEPSLDA